MVTEGKLTTEEELRLFTARNFTHPSECRNLGQIRFYIGELCNKIQELERSGHYVPEWVYQLLSQYNARQNSLILLEFRSSYR